MLNLETTSIKFNQYRMRHPMWSLSMYYILSICNMRIMCIWIVYNLHRYIWTWIFGILPLHKRYILYTYCNRYDSYIYIYISEAFNDLKRSCPKFDGQDVFLTHSEVYVSQGINEWKVSEPENAPFSWKVLTVTNYEADQIFYHPLNLP